MKVKDYVTTPSGLQYQVRWRCVAGPGGPGARRVGYGLELGCTAVRPVDKDRGKSKSRRRNHPLLTLWVVGVVTFRVRRTSRRATAPARSPVTRWSLTGMVRRHARLGGGRTGACNRWSQGCRLGMAPAS